MTDILFWGVSGLAIAAAGMCITRRSPVASALYLVVTMFCLSVLFVLLDAQFIAVLQVIVYAGAIMVVFLFVIMLLNLGRARDAGGRLPADMKGPAAIAMAAVLFALLLLQLATLGRTPPSAGITLPPGTLASLQEREGVVGAVARPLFNEFLIPFEITSILLLAAIVGAVVLAKRRL
jgi:NADH-quinone oxidoreductase subunit J